MSKYALGIDFGTLSARALLLDVQTGKEIAVSESKYRHSVMSSFLNDTISLPADWALQNPNDYLSSLQQTIAEILQKTNLKPEEVIGLGLDFTACTLIPTKADGTPLCQLEAFKNEPHAYVKLWKHHAAQYCADELNLLAEKTQQPWLKYYGGKISSEFALPKIMQILKEAPDVFKASERFIEAGDWLVWQLTGIESGSACFAGFKSLWNEVSGYPDSDFLRQLDPNLDNLVEEKIVKNIFGIGQRAGKLTKSAAEFLGLQEGTAVAVPIIDAHASVPACGISKAGKMLMIIGTSTCHILLEDKLNEVDGIAGVVKDAIIPTYYAYECGQACVGDHFEWFINNCVPQSYYLEAEQKSMSIHQLLTEKASTESVGEHGLVALDWWNGVRSPLMNSNLSGLIVGMTLQTKTEDIYRALIEATAFGTKKIIETYENGGIEIVELYAAGGIAEKNEFFMQVYADVCERTIKISGSTQSGALGSAMLGIAAADREVSGYADLTEIVEKMGRLKEKMYIPNKANAAVYQSLYEKYKSLHEYFGMEQASFMAELKELRASGLRKNRH